VIGTVLGVIFLPKQFFFPALMGYVIWGVVRTVSLGMLDRGPAPGDSDTDMPPRSEDEDDEDGVARRRRRRRRFRGRSGSHPANPHEEPRA
jgi:CDP-diacylglycerol--serine O-phosphatidyltransferase